MIRSLATKFIGAAAVAALSVSVVTATPAEARNRNGGAVVAGAILGLAAGAIVASAIAEGRRERRVVQYHDPYEAYGYGYAPVHRRAPRHVYVDPGYAYEPAPVYRRAPRHVYQHPGYSVGPHGYFGHRPAHVVRQPRRQWVQDPGYGVTHGRYPGGYTWHGNATPAAPNEGTRN